MPYRRNYPKTVAEVLRDNRKYKPAVLQAVRAFSRAKPWRGTTEERLAKFLTLNRELAAAYGVPAPSLVVMPWGDFYSPARHLIALSKLSVVTYLHEFGHALGKDERQTCIWSINLFRRIFPRSFNRCRQVGHTLVRS